MEYTKPFSTLSKEDAGIAGGKGASLGEMTQAGIPVPPGFVILAGTFDYFIHKTGLIEEIDAALDKVDHRVMHTVDAASETIEALIKRQEIPEDIKTEITEQFEKLDSEFVAVRSSATAEDGAENAWAGQLESYLNTTDETLFENVKNCWASLFTPRAIFYRFEKGLEATQISVAVVVQKMVNSEKSGIAFSVHPVTEDYNQMIIEAGFGLGEAIVSGSVTPDSYVIEKEPRKIIDVIVNNQARAMYRKEGGGNEWRDLSPEVAASQVLTEKEINQFSDVIMTIEKHYGFPCDIEWAFEGGKFYITQSRPITTLQKKSESDLQPTALSRIYSREKPLFYFSMWNDSDRRGAKRFLGHLIANNIFLIPSLGAKGSVWYSETELAELGNLVKQKIQIDPAFVPELTNTLKTNWQVLFPYLTDKKRIESPETFKDYYEHLVDWWSAMNTAFYIPDMEEADAEVRKQFLSHRVEGEKYTEKMSKLMVAFWKEYFPEFADLAFYIAPSEIEKFSKNPELLLGIKERKNGCGMLNGIIFPLSELDTVLKENNLVFEKISIDLQAEIKGTTAYKGKVCGPVKKLASFKDMSSFKPGDILVTEMTNPDYLPIMKIAGAVVTDEGGTTCHAAIASRELKIPCVVGTKIATHVLNDGDMVEVNATAGIVRILESKSGVSKYNPENYHFWGQWNQPVLSWSFWEYWSLTEAAQKLPVEIEYEPTPLLTIAGHFFIQKTKYYKEIGEIAYQEIGSKKSPLIDYLFKVASDFNKQTEGFFQIPADATQAYIEKSFAVHKEAMFFWTCSVVFDEAIERALEKVVASGEVDRESILNQGEAEIVPISFQDREMLNKWQGQLIQKGFSSSDSLEKIISVDPVFGAELSKYQKQTEYMGTHHYWGEPRSSTLFLEQVWKSAASDGTVEKSKKPLPEKYQKLANLAHRATLWRLQIAERVAQINYAARPALQKLAGDNGLSYVQLLSYSCDEITASIKVGGKLELSLSEIASRESGYVGDLDTADNSLIILTGEPKDQLLAKFVDSRGSSEKVEIIKGTIGNTGKATGRVAIVLEPKDLYKVEDGMVLVTSMTTPDFLPVMHKAVAFVTDIGGITCHAAIIAREMKKPCIIGTKNATKVLKDGDIIEVNADTGIIAIIS